MKTMCRRLAVLEAKRNTAGEGVKSILVILVSRDEQGELQETPHWLMIPGDPAQYLVADYAAWPRHVQAIYDSHSP